MEESERKKVIELLKEMRNHKDSESNKADESTRLNWMYKGTSDLINREDYLLGKSIDKAFEDLNNPSNSDSCLGRTGEQSNVPKRMLEKTDCTDQVELEKKILEDPLYAIKQKELEARKQILNNPVKLKQIKQMLLARNKINESEKKQKKKKLKKKKLSPEKLNLKITHLLKKLSEKEIKKALNVVTHSHSNKTASEKFKSKKAKKKLKHSKRKKNKSSSSSSTSSSTSSSSSSSSALSSSASSSSSSDSDSDSKEKLQKVCKSKSDQKEKIQKRKHKSSSDLSSTENEKEKLKTKKTNSKSKFIKTNKKFKKPVLETNSKKHYRDSSSSSDDSFVKLKRKKKNSLKNIKMFKNSPYEKELKNSHKKISKNEYKSRGNNETELRIRNKNKDKVKKSSDRESTTKNDREIENSKIVCNNSSDEKCSTKKYGLMLPDGAKPIAEKPVVAQYEKPIETKMKYVRPSKPEPLSKKEQEKRLNEMMEDAKKRKKEREQNLAKHRKKIEKEEIIEDYDDDFMRRQITHLTSADTVTDRIKSNINNIQRSKSSMDSSFVRR